VAKKFKNDLVQTQDDSSPSTKLAECSENTIKLQQARQQLMAAGRQAFSFVTWTSSDHTISLWRRVNALVKTSDQPTFSSSNFSPFTSAEAL
jgi:hypothetical protein